MGYTTVSGNTPTLRATLWQASVAFDLNTYLLASVQDDGWILTVASGINDEGSVVGMAYNTISATYSPFLLVAAAVPEPSTSLSVLIGLGVLASIRHGRRAHSRS